MGTHSSLAGKIQKLKDKDFGKQALRKEHVNPPAEVSTSLKTYQHFTLEKAYLREDFFWAFTPAAGDFIRFRFFQPLRLERSVPAPWRRAGWLPGGRLPTDVWACRCPSVTASPLPNLSIASISLPETWGSWR